MKHKFTLSYMLKRAAALLLVPALLVSCTGKTKVAEPSKTVGVSRAAELVLGDAERVEVVPEGVMSVVDEQPPLTNTDSSESFQT